MFYARQKVMLQTESIERVLKVISRYYLTHTPDIHLTIAEQKYKQIKGNEKIRNEIQNSNL